MKRPVSKLPSRLAAFAGIILLLLGAVGLWQRQNIADYWRYSQYQPTAAIADISNRVGFSRLGQFYFYASEPSLDGTQNFTKTCAKHERSTNIIGCYVNQRIHLFDVDNPELVGIEEVTAAHEMLHAAYDRLSTSAKQQVDSMLEQEISRHLDDSTLIERMKVYDGLSHQDKLHEYHSVLATEVRQIDSQLEQYYQRYFTDRSQVVALYERYAGVFRGLVEESEALAASLDKQAVEINQRVSSYNQANANLSSSIASFNQRAEGGEFRSATAFSAERQRLLDRSARLDQEYQQINWLIASYDVDKQRYEGLAEHLTTLNNSLDSSLAPAPEVN